MKHIKNIIGNPGRETVKDDHNDNSCDGSEASEWCMPL